jgi:hypothetical protein
MTPAYAIFSTLVLIAPTEASMSGAFPRFSTSVADQAGHVLGSVAQEG